MWTDWQHARGRGGRRARNIQYVPGSFRRETCLNVSRSAMAHSYYQAGSTYGTHSIGTCAYSYPNRSRTQRTRTVLGGYAGTRKNSINTCTYVCTYVVRRGILHSKGSRGCDQRDHQAGKFNRNVICTYRYLSPSIYPFFIQYILNSSTFATTSGASSPSLLLEVPASLATTIRVDRY